MAKFDLTIGQDIEIMRNYSLNPAELLLVKLIVLAFEGDRAIYDFCSLPNECIGDKRETIVSLQNKGIITKEYKIPHKGELFDPCQVIFNKNFLNTFYKASFILGNELFEAYPSFTYINGVLTGIRTVSKKFNSLEEFFAAYGKAIKYNKELHSHIIELVNWAKENNLINYSLSSFLIDRRWELLDELRNGDIGNINFDNVRIL